MCGIFASTGDGACEQTLAALKFLEYRGYDSAGLAAKTHDGLVVAKTAGRVEKLAALAKEMRGTPAIGHTRWATHGRAVTKNAHPFLSYGKNFVVAHNGIVENFAELKSALEEDGVRFSSDTDSEVIAHLLEKNYRGDVRKCLAQTVKALRGSFAVVVLTTFSDGVFAARSGSPLCLGLGEDGTNYLCSDVATLGNFCSSVAYLPDGSFAEVGAKTEVFDEFGNHISPNFFEAHPVEAESRDDFMMKEMREAPDRLEDCFRYYRQSGGLGLDGAFLRKLRRVYFVGCGSAYHSGLSAADVLRKYSDLDVHVVLASEFIYGDYVCGDNTLVFAVTQSGETADTLKAVQAAEKRGALTYAVTNVADSSVCFCARKVKFIRAGAEIAVASTKAYLCQTLALTLACLDVAKARKCLSADAVANVLSSFSAVPGALDEILSRKDELKKLAEFAKDVSAAYYLGKGADLAAAQEGSLKLKEISYVHSEAYAAGELKHGTLALMEKGVVAVVLATQNALVDKCVSASSEVVSRGADVVAFTPFGNAFSGVAKRVFALPVTAEVWYPLVSGLSLELFAYYSAKLRGKDVDKPRNLAKSVTVE